MPNFEGKTLQNPMGPSYRVERRVAGGGFSEVYAATVVDSADFPGLVNEGAVAVKIFDSEDLSWDQLQQIHSRESINLNRLARRESPFLHRILDQFEDEEIRRFCIVTELVEGVRLKEKIRELRALPADERVKQALRYSIDITLAMQECQTCQIVHGDLNPNNILIRQINDRAILIDFGFSRSLIQAAREEKLSLLPPLGTYQYAAPEQYNPHAQADVRTDMYSFGCTLFEMLTGYTPFAEFGSDRERIRKAAISVPRPLLGALAPDLDDRHPVVHALNTLIQRCMNVALSERFDRWVDIRLSLEDILNEHNAQRSR